MSATAIRILVIGKRSSSTSGTLKRLAVRGWGSHCVETLLEARELLEAFRFDVVLAMETLSDGRGYDVSEATIRHSGMLLVGVPLSESLLWLAVIERGARVLGKRALNASMLEKELEKLLATLANDNVREVIRNPKPRADRPPLQRAVLPERPKSADARPA